MDKRQIKINRKKRYFINSGKAIIDENGLDSLSVKKIANRAGFAAGTLYNYFNDLNHLQQYILIDYFDECIEFVEQSIDSYDMGYKKVEKAFLSYSDYFINNPNAFNLIFLKELGEIQEDVKNELINPKINVFFHNLLSEYLNKKIASQEKLRTTELSIANTVHGSLLFYLKGRTTYDEKTFKSLLKGQLKYILMID